jgi:hypothetical protein
MTENSKFKMLASAAVAAGATAVSSYSSVFPKSWDPIFAYGGAAILAIGGVYLGYDWLKSASHWHIRRVGGAKFRILIPLQLAAVEAYTVNRQENPDHRHYIEALTMLNDGTDLRLQHFAELLADGVALYGYHLPSTEIEQIDFGLRGKISANCNSFVDRQEKIIYQDLMIEKRAVKKFIASIKANAKNSAKR